MSELTELLEALLAPAAQGQASIAPPHGLQAFVGQGEADSAQRGPYDLERLISSMSKPLERMTITAKPKRTESGDSANWAEGVGRTLLSGFGVASLFRGLFGGDSDNDVTPVAAPFNLPASIRAEVAYRASDQSFRPMERYADGSPRQAAVAPQIAVNVTAMDSRSFLDHSDDIARAVRNALLHSHPLQDVITEL